MPLKRSNSGAWTEDEAYTIYREKLVRLRTLYTGRLARLKHSLAERRREYLLEWMATGGDRADGKDSSISDHFLHIPFSWAQYTSLSSFPFSLSPPTIIFFPSQFSLPPTPFYSSLSTLFPLPPTPTPFTSTPLSPSLLPFLLNHPL